MEIFQHVKKKSAEFGQSTQQQIAVGYLCTRTDGRLILVANRTNLDH